MRYLTIWYYLFTFTILSSNVLAAPINIETRSIRLVEKYYANQRWDSCLFYHYVLAHHYRQYGDPKRLADSWMDIAVIELLRQNTSQAETAQKLANSYNPDKGPKAYARLNNLYNGLLYFQKKSWNESISLLKKCDNNNKRHNLINLTIGKSYYNLDQNNKARAELTALLYRMKKSRDTLCFEFAEAREYLGFSFNYNNEINKHIDYASLAAKAFESIKLFNINWLDCYKNILNSYWILGQTRQNDQYFQHLTQIVEKYKLPDNLQFEYFLTKALFYKSKQNKKEALDAYAKALDSHIASSKDKNNIIPNIIELCFTLKQYQNAINWSKQLEPSLMNEFHASLLAQCYLRLNQKDKAEAIIDKIKENSYQPSDRTSWSLSNYYFEAKNYDRAEYYYKIALKKNLKNFGPSCPTTAESYSSLGYFYWMARADYQRSLDNYHKEIQALTKGQKLSNYFQLPDINNSINDEYLARALNNKGEALCELAKHKGSKEEAIHYLKAGLAHFELSAKVAHRYKMSLARDEQRLMFSDYIKHRYPYIIKTSLNLYQKTEDKKYLEKAFEYTEKSKASLLLSAVRGVNAYKMHQIPAPLKNSEEDINNNIEMLSRMVSEEYKLPKPNTSKIDQYNNTLYHLQQKRDSLVNFFKRKYPSYYNALYNSEVTSTVSLQKLLSANEAILQYSVNKDFMCIFLITPSQFTYYTTTLDNQFFGDVESFLRKLSSFSFTDLNDSCVRSFAKLSNHLYSHLVKPFASQIVNKKLIIIPDDILNQIPFEALVSRLPSFNQKSRYKDMNFLIKEHSISYNYSGTLFALNHKAQYYPNTRLLAVAPEYRRLKFSTLLQKDKEAMRGDSSEIAPIPGTLAEAKKISAIFGGSTLLKGKATKNEFEKISENFDILHLAMHGIINNEYPMFSKLVFATNKDTSEDIFLNTYEIYNMNLNAPLIVLSACNTGSGKLHTGEGIMSLARGFFTAGAKSLVMTLWSVADKTSSKLMGNFYNNLAHKLPISDALCKAKLDYLNESDEIAAHPYFWAGYISMGNNSSTFEPQKTYSKYFLSGGLIIALIPIMLIRKRWKDKKNQQKNSVQ